MDDVMTLKTDKYCETLYPTLSHESIIVPNRFLPRPSRKHNLRLRRIMTLA